MREREREQSMLWIRHVELNPLTTDPAKVKACSSTEFFFQRHLGENLPSADVVHRRTETYTSRKTRKPEKLSAFHPLPISDAYV